MENSFLETERVELPNLDEQIGFIDEKVKWLMDHGESHIVLEIYTAILESLYRLKDLEK